MRHEPYPLESKFLRIDNSQKPGITALLLPHHLFLIETILIHILESCKRRNAERRADTYWIQLQTQCWRARTSQNPT